MNKDRITLLLVIAVVCIIVAVLLGGICIQMHHYLMYMLKSALPMLQI